MFNKKGKQLTTLAERTKGKIIGFTDDEICSRLMAMGILPGTEIEIIRKAPLKSGYYIKFDNQRVALRNVEAASIVVK